MPILSGIVKDPSGAVIPNADVTVLGIPFWDISTGTYASKSMSVATQSANPYGLAFSADGTKAYVTDNTTNTVYQYGLTTAWDISTGTYASKSMSVATQTTNPGGLAFSADGAKAYVGNFSSRWYQYGLTTAWDISTGTYASKSMSVAGQETSTTGLAFSADGAKAYVVGVANDTVYQYGLTTTPFVAATLTADGLGAYTHTTTFIETDLQVVASTVGPPRRFGATDNNLATA